MTLLREVVAFFRPPKQAARTECDLHVPVVRAFTVGVPDAPAPVCHRIVCGDCGRVLDFRTLENLGVFVGDWMTTLYRADDFPLAPP